MYKSRSIIAIALSAGLIFGCKAGERPENIVQICVQNEQGVNDFLREMQSIAKQNGMEYLDNSDQTRRDLLRTLPPDAKIQNAGNVLNISVERPDGLGLMAGNIGLSKYQIAIGFSYGSNRSDGRGFWKDVSARLGKHWRVETLTSKEGARPMQGCG